MSKWRKRSQVVYQCSYHIVWCPKYRFRILEGAVGKYVEERIRAMCEWKDSEVEELSVMKDHVHLVVTVPPKVSISERRIAPVHSAPTIESALLSSDLQPGLPRSPRRVL